MSCLTRLKTIGRFAFAHCPALKSADLSGLERLERVGGLFMSQCTSLESIELSHLKALTMVGNEFFSSSNLKPALVFTLRQFS